MRSDDSWSRPVRSMQPVVRELLDRLAAHLEDELLEAEVVRVSVHGASIHAPGLPGHARRNGRRERAEQGWIGGVSGATAPRGVSLSRRSCSPGRRSSGSRADRCAGSWRRSAGRSRSRTWGSASARGLMATRVTTSNACLQSLQTRSMCAISAPRPRPRPARTRGRPGAGAALGAELVVDARRREDVVLDDGADRAGAHGGARVVLGTGVFVDGDHSFSRVVTWTWRCRRPPALYRRHEPVAAVKSRTAPTRAARMPSGLADVTPRLAKEATRRPPPRTVRTMRSLCFRSSRTSGLPSSRVRGLCRPALDS